MCGMGSRAAASRWYRPVALGLTVLIGIAGVAIFVARYGGYVQTHQIGFDLTLMQELGHRWLTTGSMYLPYQLSGPYAHDINTLYSYDSATGTFDFPAMPALYPPIAGPLFVISTAVPLLWWAVPIAITGAVIVYHRPAPWTWPLMVLPFLIPATSDPFITGNPTMWGMAAVALGTLWGWPALLLVFVKPTFAPFALVAFCNIRGAVLGGLLIALFSAVFAPEWIRYITVVENLRSPGFLYSAWWYPLLFIPVLAWIGRTHRPEVSAGYRPSRRWPFRSAPTTG